MNRFLRRDGGSIAMTYALAGASLMALSLAGIDLTRISMARNNLQAALDSGTLAASGSHSMDQEVVAGIGKKFVAAALSADTIMLDPKSSFILSSTTLVGEATAEVQPIILGLLTDHNIKITVHAEAVRGQQQVVELALVLDTTGSMSGAKITTLKVAAADMVTSLFNASDTGTVKIAIIPFAQHVNLGIASRNETWADVPADKHIYHQVLTAQSCMTNQCDTIQVACQVAEYGAGTCNGTTPVYGTCTSYNDGTPVNYTCQTGTKPTTYACQVQTGSHPGTCNQQVNCKSVQMPTCPAPIDTSWWEESHFYGCYGSPAYPDNVRDSDSQRKYPGLMNVSCSAPAIALTTNSATVITAIKALTATGETYIPAGLAWGFNMLSTAQPMTAALAYDTDGPNIHPRKIMVLMTDGANTKQMNHGAGKRGIHDVSAIPAKEADTYTRELCSNIKDKNIEVYTVAFAITGNPDAKTLVQSCATDAAHFFDAADQTALLSAFSQIGKSIQNLRLSR